MKKTRIKILATTKIFAVTMTIVLEELSFTSFSQSRNWRERVAEAAMDKFATTFSQITPTVSTEADETIKAAYAEAIEAAEAFLADVQENNKKVKTKKLSAIIDETKSVKDKIYANELRTYRDEEYSGILLNPSTFFGEIGYVKYEAYAIGAAYIEAKKYAKKCKNNEKVAESFKAFEEKAANAIQSDRDIARIMKQYDHEVGEAIEDLLSK